MTSTTSRRGLLAFLSVAPVATVAKAELISTHPAGSHLDGELVVAGERWRTAVAAFRDADASYQAAAEAVRSMLGDCPPDLIAGHYGRCILVDANDVSGGQMRLDWDRITTHEGDAYVDRWDGAAVRHVIRWLPKARGRAGHTPNTIRYLRSLIPAADARDGMKAMAEKIHGPHRLGTTRSAARTAVDEAEALITSLPALTPAGLALKARMARHRLAEWDRDGCGRKQPNFITGLIDAAIAAGGEA